jgi:hypothetical protein
MVSSVMRAGLEAPTAGPDASRWCVGVAVDVDGGQVY